MILMIDNYDSFTWNLVQMLAAAGEQVEVVRNDAAEAGELLARRPLGIVVSPGPGRPEGAGICVELIRRQAPVPVLGVCLGHQALAFACGAKVERAARPMHGKTSRVRHLDEGVFAGLPNPFEATRYHSLAVPEASLPEELRAVAWSEDDGVLMGVVHRRLPYFGVQFHPESVLTAAGPHLVGNFLDICRRQAKGQAQGRGAAAAAPAAASPGSAAAPAAPAAPAAALRPGRRAARRG
jgi:anthranilate synthase/aminodeoxychorismate synthase-like glutamine amidotransferase